LPATTLLHSSRNACLQLPCCTLANGVSAECQPPDAGPPQPLGVLQTLPIPRGELFPALSATSVNASSSSLHPYSIHAHNKGNTLLPIWRARRSGCLEGPVPTRLGGSVHWSCAPSRFQIRMGQPSLLFAPILMATWPPAALSRSVAGWGTPAAGCSARLDCVHVRAIRLHGPASLACCSAL